MSSNGFPDFDISDLTALNNNTYYGGYLNFDESDWNVAGPSQPYVGVDVQGDLNGYPDLLTPNTAPISLYPDHGVIPGEGYLPFSPQRDAATLHPSPSHSPILTLSPGVPFITPKARAAPITAGKYPGAQSQATFNPDGLVFDFPTATGRPAVHTSPSHVPSYDGSWGYSSSPGPSNPNVRQFHPTAGVTTPEAEPPEPAESSVGPQRTRQAARKARRYNPAKPAKKKAELVKDNWNLTLVRFRSDLDPLFSVRNGQPSGGIKPEMALAEVNKSVKDDLKQSPLQGKKSGEGARKGRSAEDYLKGLLRAIRPVEPTPTTAANARLPEDETVVALLSRVADEFESTLEAVNPEPALRQAASRRKSGKEGGRESEAEKVRRSKERHQLERMSLLFKAQRPWERKEVLGLAILVLLYGPNIFPQHFIKVRPTTPGS